MKCLSELCQGMVRMLRARVKTDCKLSLSLYDENADTPECTHNYACASQHPLSRLLGWLCWIVLLCAAARVLFCLIAKLCHS